MDSACARKSIPRHWWRSRMRNLPPATAGGAITTHPALSRFADQGKKLSQKNGHLIALNILTQTNSQAQTQLYTAAEQNGRLLRDRQRTIEELNRENEDLRRWADSPLPDPVVRLRQRPALAGGESYREWLSQNHPLPAGPGRAAK
ncbi:Rz-like lysis system protein LysB [Pantoea sp. RRHST58]|uniref:Rz-like lysis system protein LysB n=1 Tax=Pantoea sp. RRHST58 TaxID=3425183 RepID=UPI003DA164F1